MWMLLIKKTILQSMIFALVFCCVNIWGNEIGEWEYEVEFLGVSDKDLLEKLKQNSTLVFLKGHPPPSEAALRRRAEGDIPNFRQVLQNDAYYGTKIKIDFDIDTKPIHIKIQFELGPVFNFACFNIESNEYNIHPYEIDITLNTPAYSKKIFEAENNLILILAGLGYPLASIESRKVVADPETCELGVTLCVNYGPLASFGPTTILGNCSVSEGFIRKKIQWDEGNIYDPRLVDRTMRALETAAIFSCITIQHDEEPGEDDELPMTIEVVEGKMRSIATGLSVSTQRGAGFTFQWENRNFRNRGQRLGFETTIYKDKQEAILHNLIPDFGRRNQDLVLQVEFLHETTKGYTESSFSLSSILERQVNVNTRVSWGTMYTQLRDTHSEEGNGDFNLFKIPLTLKWHRIDDLLDPTRGASIYAKSIPSCEVVGHKFGYAVNTVTCAFYRPIKNECFVFASRLIVGSIWGSSRRNIPPSERFYAGSENTLRGYRYLTVSPLEDNDPVGGRSMMIGSVEFRWRAMENLGLVAFYDAGNVYKTIYPKFDDKILRSVGIGISYYTPVGPLRLDIAYPIDRRKIDGPVQVYFSVGQAF